MFLETGAMGHQTAQRNGNAAGRRRDDEVDVTVHVTVEIDAAVAT
jgi:hypothetical protein